jgi:hypothetical protein
MTPKTIEQLRKAIRLNDALYNKVAGGEISLSKAGSLFERQVSYEINKALKMALEDAEEE